MAKKKNEEIGDAPSGASRSNTLKNIIQTKYKDLNCHIASDIQPVEKIPSGLYALDAATGGGLCRGFPIIAYGAAGTTKSSLCCKIAGNAKKILDLPVSYIYTEGPFESQREWAFKCGLPEDTLIIEESRLEPVLDTALEFIRSGAISCLIIDSLGSIAPAEHIQDVSSSEAMMLRARSINKFFALIAPNLPRENHPLIIATTHFYDTPTRFGKMETMAGGGRQKYLCGLILKLFSSDDGMEKISEGDETTAWKLVKWVIEKNKFGPIKGKGTFRLYVQDTDELAGTFSEAPEALIRGMVCGEIKKSASWYIYKGKKIQGENKIMKELDIPEIFQKYEEFKKSVMNKGEAVEEIDIEVPPNDEVSVVDGE